MKKVVLSISVVAVIILVGVIIGWNSFSDYSTTFSLMKFESRHSVFY